MDRVPKLVIGTRNPNDLTLDELCDEYTALKKTQKAKGVFPQGGTGWANSVLDRIEQRLTLLRTTIADEVSCEEDAVDEFCKPESEDGNG